MAPRNAKRILVSVLVLVFCIFFVSYETVEHNEVKASLKAHAEVIKEALWNLDSQSPSAYLDMAARHDGHEMIGVYVSHKKEPFIFIQGPKPSFLERILIKVHLIPKIDLNETVTFGNQVIGNIKVLHLHDTIFVYLYFIVVLVLIYTAAIFFIQTSQAKSALEQRVRERTAELKESEEKFRTLVESSTDFIWETDGSGRYTYSSPKVKDILGYEASEIVGRTPFEFMPDTESQRLKKLMSEFSADRKPIIRLENINRHKNGQQIIFETNAIPVIGPKGEFLGYRGIDRDVTSRKQAEEKFRRSANFTRALLDAVPTPVFYKDRDGRYQGCNRAFSEYMGVTLEEIKGKTVHELWPGDKAESDHCTDLDLMRNPQAQYYEYSVEDKNGEERPVILAKDVFRNEEGDVSGLIVAFLDISQLKQTEEELRKANNIIASSPVVAFRWKNKQGWPVDYVSKNVNALIGHTADYFLSGKASFLQLIHPDDVERVTEEVNSHSDDNTIDEFNHEPYRIITATGEVKWIDDLTFICRDPHGVVTHYDGIVFDITERKQAEDDLRHLRKYLSSIIDSMPSILIGVDINGKITQWNSEARRVTGIASTAAVGQPLERVYPRLAVGMERIRAAMNANQVRSDRRRARKENGITLYEDVTIYPLVVNGIEGAVIRVDDVTEWVHLEEMMVQSEKMLSVGGLAAGMAHEINNPLAGMLQTAGVMSNRLSSRLDSPANRDAAETAGTTIAAIEEYMQIRGIPRMLRAIEESGQRVANIVGNMLSFARKSDSTQSLHALEELADKSLELAATDYDLKRQYDFKIIDIVKEYADNFPLVPCEPAKIQQVLLNIFHNGAQAMQEVATEKPRFIVRTYTTTAPKRACIEIEDNGPGMSDDVRKRVFEPFFTTKPTGSGTGLGLSVSYFIITENHGGEMEVESQPDAGAKFIIRLPV